MKSVVMICPDKRFVERDPKAGMGHPLLIDAYETYWTKSCPIISVKEFWRRMRLVNKLLNRYRKEEHQVYWAMFSKEGYPEVPDTESIHPIYRVTPQDRVISVGVSYMRHTREMNYPNERKVLSGLELGEEAVFGGFHEDDCVSRFAGYATRLGVRAKVDKLLTEHGLLCLAETFNQDLDAFLIRNGTMIPDEEYNPETEKTFNFEGRLTKRDLRIRYKV